MPVVLEVALVGTALLDVDLGVESVEIWDALEGLVLSEST